MYTFGIIPDKQRTGEACQHSQGKTKAQEIWPVPLDVVYSLMHYPP